jgi:hypothetical protein
LQLLGIGGYVQERPLPCTTTSALFTLAHRFLRVILKL